MTGVPTDSARQDRYPRSVGIIGLHPFGIHLVRRLTDTLPANVHVTVFDQEMTDTVELASMAAVLAVSPADLVARSEVVIVLVADMAELERDLGGPSGLQAGVNSPTTLVIGMSVPAEDLYVLSTRLGHSTAGLLRLVDAPLDGDLDLVDAGRLAIEVGAAPGDLAAIRPLLELLGHCEHVGEVGSGQLAYAHR